MEGRQGLNKIFMQIKCAMLQNYYNSFQVRCPIELAHAFLFINFVAT